MKALQAKGLTASLLAVTLVFAVSCSEKSATLGPSFSVLTGPARIEIAPPGDTLNALGDTLTLTATVYDSADVVLPNAVTWGTSSVDRATVTNGFVTTTGRGKVNITARIGTVRGVSKLLVRQVVDTIVVTPTLVDVPVGDTIRLTAAAADSNGAPVLGGRIIWRTSNAVIATVDSTGLVTMHSGGAVYITARISGTDIVSTEVGRSRLRGVYGPGSFEISPAVDTIRTIGSSIQLTATPITVAGVPKPPTWKTLNPGLVTIDSVTGVVTAVGRGAARIVATVGGLADTSDVRVLLTTAAVSVTPATLALSIGDTSTLTGVQLDSSGFEFGVLTWSSRNTAVATVNSAGQVTAVAGGSVFIVGARLGFSDSTLVTVSLPDATTHSWTTGVAGDWTDATKWTPGVVPATTDSATVPLTGSAVSLTANATIAALSLGAGTSVSLGAFNLSVTTNLDLDPLAGMTSSGGFLLLTGTGSFRGAVPKTQVLGVRNLSGNATLSGPLTIDGGGALTIDSNALVINNP
jgi:uncharacterized protein YjdB